MDVVRIFSGLSAGQQHNLNRAIRNLFNFLEAQGFNVAYLNLLRKNIPRDHVGVDLKVPEESDILESLRKLPKAPEKYVALYNLLLDSGLRLVEGIMLIERFNPDKCEHLSGFYRFPIGEFRGSKQAYYAYFTEVTHKEITGLNGKINLDSGNASHYYRKYGYVAPKYLRKFVFDKMISLGIPESVADFIEGRIPRRVGAKHYMAL